jgi:Chaperone of endosialidase
MKPKNTPSLQLRNSINRSLWRRSVFLFPLALVCFGLSPATRAVSPAPDGGYPGQNTAEGEQALLSLTTGLWNTALGFQALKSDTTGYSNTATGGRALFSNTAGIQNTANGAFALFANTLGSGNSAFGFTALTSNTTGGVNTATGYFALTSNTTGGANTANGFATLGSNTTGNFNTANGAEALEDNTTGFENTANGANALGDNTIGRLNTAIGSGALRWSITGNRNTAIGAGALSSGFNENGNDNIALGFEAGIFVGTANHVICIGSPGAHDVSNSCFIGNIRGKTTENPDAIPVLIDSDGQLGTRSSSRQYKTDIKPMDKASESILALKPVSFHYKVHKDTTPQFGLIAEEVAQVNPDLVIYDADGKPYTVRYDAVNAMVLNEFLKEHRKNEEQEATIAKQRKDFDATLAQQQKQIHALTAGLEKVSAQLEASKPAPQVVNNP